MGVRGTEQNWGGGVNAVEQNLENADREPRLAVCLTQTIKTTEARIQNFSEWWKKHFCISQETQRKQNKGETRG